eukprot:487518_1
MVSNIHINNNINSKDNPLFNIHNLNWNHNSQSFISFTNIKCYNNYDNLILMTESNTNHPEQKSNYIKFLNSDFISNYGNILNIKYENLSTITTEFENCNWINNTDKYNTSKDLIKLETLTMNVCEITNILNNNLDLSYVADNAQLIFENNNFNLNALSNSLMNVECNVIYLIDTNFNENHGKQSSGILTNQCLVSLLNVNFSRNSGEYFGSIYDHNINGQRSQYFLNNIIFYKNTARYGSGFALSYMDDQYGPVINAKDIKCVHNIASDDGGCIYIFGNSTFYDFEKINFKNLLCESNSANQGGCIFVKDFSLKINGMVATDNNATFGAVIVALSQQCLISNNSNIPQLIMVNSNFDKNDAYEGGVLISDCYHIIISGVRFDNNMAQKRGGSLILHQSCVNITDTSFINNKGQIGGSLAISSLSSYCVNTLSNIIFENNLAHEFGGAIHINNLWNINEEKDKYLLSKTPNPNNNDKSILDIIHTNFTNNKNGAISVSRHWGDGDSQNFALDEVNRDGDINPQILNINIDNIYFVNNIGDTSSTINWFIEENSLSEINISDSLFINSTSIKGSNTNYHPFGSSIWVTCWLCYRGEKEKDLFKNKDIDKCHCSDSKNHLNATLYIDNSNFSNNIGFIGGAISTSCGTTVITNSIFYKNGNTATNIGGAVSLRSLYRIYETVFIANQAQYGGGLFVSCSKYSILSDKIFIHENEAHIGAGLYMAQVNNFILNDIEWRENVAKFGGAAITFKLNKFIEKTFGELTNQLFFDNLSPFATSIYMTDSIHSLLLFNEREDKYSIKINKNVSIARTEGLFTFNTTDLDILDGLTFNDINLFYLRLFISPSNEKIYSKLFKWTDNEIGIRLCDDSECNGETQISIINQDFSFSEFLILQKKSEVEIPDNPKFRLYLNTTSFFNSLEYSNMIKSAQIFTVNFTIYGVVQNDIQSDIQNTFNIDMDIINIQNSVSKQDVTIPGEIRDTYIDAQQIMGFGTIYVDIDNINNNNSAVNISIKNSHFNNNEASIGGITTIRANNKYPSSIQYYNCIFKDNIADISAPIIAGLNIILTIDDSNIDKSYSRGDSGVLYIIDSELKIYSSVIQNTYSSTIGGISIHHSKLEMIDTKCENNEAKYGYGACIYMSDIARFIMYKNPNIIIPTEILQIERCDFSHNYAAKGGASIYIDTSYDDKKILNTVNRRRRRRRLPQNTNNDTNITNICNSNAININYEFNNKTYSFHSKPVILHSHPLFEEELYSKKLLVFGSYPFKECLSLSNYTNFTQNLTDTIGLIITESKCNDDINIIKKLSNESISGIIIYTNNYIE